MPEESAALAGLHEIRARQRDRVLELAAEVSADPSDGEAAAVLLGYARSPRRWDEARAPLSVEEGRALANALLELGRFGDARGWFERAVAAAEQGDVHGRVDQESLGRSLHQVGFCLSSVGEFEEARGWFERAVAAAEQGDVHGRVDQASLGTSLHSVGFCLASVGEFEEARGWFERAVAAKEQGDVHGRVDEQSLRLSRDALLGLPT